MNILYQVALALSVGPPAAVMLGGGLLLLRAAPRVGRPAKVAGVALVALFITIAVAIASGVVAEHYLNMRGIFKQIDAVTLPIAAVVCGLVVRAAAHGSRPG